MTRRVATDIGGTFTDLIVLNEEDGELRLKKVSTRPDAPEEGVMEAVAQSEIDLEEVLLFFHGTTIAINTLLEGKGARTALITTRGFRDVYEIGRANRLEMYNIFYRKPVPLVSRDLRFELEERILANGEILVPFQEESARSLIRHLKTLAIDSVAVCLINSYANPLHEIRLGELLQELWPEISVTLSHHVLREYREYERTSTCCVNAYIGPRVASYVQSLEGNLTQGGFAGTLLIMQSNGGVMTASSAISRPINLMESGPSAGVVGASRIGCRLGYQDIISFDMGGTTAKAALIEGGTPKMSHVYRVGGRTGHPMIMPVTDLVEVGAGGGSIAWSDEGGGLKVGPRSAGAVPGPACYGRSGTEPTVTDANLLTGRLNPDYFLGGDMKLDVEAAGAAVSRLAGQFHFPPKEMALGILKIVNSNMLNALRAVTVERGHDPRDFVMVAYGGGGPTHAAILARELKIPTVVVPLFPGNFSALGMLYGDLKHDFSRTLVRSFEEVSPEEVEQVFGELEQEGLCLLDREGMSDSDIVLERYLDMRYVGQEHTVSVPVHESPFGSSVRMPIRRRFDEMHQQRYGICEPEALSEIVNLRLSAIGRVREPTLPLLEVEGKALGSQSESGRRQVLREDGSWFDCPIFRREHLKAGNRIPGPAVIEEYAATTMLFESDQVVVDEYGHLIIQVGV